MAPKPTFATVLRQARRQAGLSRPQVSEALDLGHNTLARVEDGRYDCNRRTAAMLVRFYGLPPETMLL